MRLLRIVPDDTKFDFMRFRRISFPVSALMSILAITLYFTHGLNFGIDFKGGTLIEIQTKSGQPADLAKMRSSLNSLGLGDVQLQQFGAPDDVLIRIAEQPGGDAAQQVAVAKARGALGSDVDYRRVEVVGPRVSGELLSYGVVGLMLAIFCILIYLWFRFEWQFALGAMIANVHDLVLTIGFMSLTGIDFDLTSIAALLTILGYSLNDTVVIYDRIREMLRRFRKLPMPDLLNASVNQTLSRSVITHVTVSLALLALLAVRRAGDPFLHRHHDVRRGAGRHLHFGVHRFADLDLSRRRHRAGFAVFRAGQAEGRLAMAGGLATDAPHLPRPAPIDAYGNGGFRFACMSHRGSILCLPDGIWAWPVGSIAALNEAALAPIFARAGALDIFLVGAGRDPAALPDNLRGACFATPAFRSTVLPPGRRRRPTIFCWTKTAASAPA